MRVLPVLVILLLLQQMLVSLLLQQQQPYSSQVRITATDAMAEAAASSRCIIFIYPIRHCCSTGPVVSKAPPPACLCITHAVMLPTRTKTAAGRS
jgi:hypothetical protein